MTGWMRVLWIAALLFIAAGCGCGEDDEDAGGHADDDASPDDDTDDDTGDDDDSADDDTWPPLPDDDGDDDVDDDTDLPPLPDPSYGWILLDSDRTHVSWVLNQAADYGIDHVQLSHDLIMDIDEINEDAGHAATLRDIAQEAKSLGLEVWVWSHEFARESYLLCLDPEDDLWTRRAQAYRDALETIPEIDGVILMFGSAEVEPWYAVCLCDWCRELPDTGNPVLDLINSRPIDRLTQIYDAVGGVVMGEFGKKLRVRTFMHQPLEILWLGESLRTYPNHDLSVMTKDVPQDWQPYYPDDPLIGDVGHRHQIIEMDLGNEYWGQSRILNGQVDYIAGRWAYDKAHGALGAAARIERGSQHAFGNPNEINIYAYSRIVIDGSSPDDIYREWFDAKYGIDGDSVEADVLKRVFRTSHDAMRKMYYTLGMWTLVKGSDVPDSARFPEQLVPRNSAYYDGDWWDTSEDLAFPDEQTLADLWQEASEALEIAQDNLDALESIEPAFTDPTQYEELRDMLALQRDACVVWRHVKDAMFRYMFSQRGQLTLAHSDAAMRSFRLRAEMGKHAGIRAEVVDAQTVQELCPHVNMDFGGQHEVLGGLWHADGGTARHDAVAWGYAKRAAERGVEIHQRTEVTGFGIAGGRVTEIRTNRGTVLAGQVLQAAGGMNGRIAEMAGIRLPIRCFPLQAMVTQPLKPFLDILLSSSNLHTYLVQSSRGEIVIGGGTDPYQLASTRSSLPQKEALATGALQLMPFLHNVKLLRQWAGITDITPDFSPIMGASPLQNYWLDAGWGTWGFKATAVAGKRMAETIATGRVPDILMPFALERFARFELLNEMGATAAGH